MLRGSTSHVLQPNGEGTAGSRPEGCHGAGSGPTLGSSQTSSGHTTSACWLLERDEWSWPCSLSPLPAHQGSTQTPGIAAAAPCGSTAQGGSGEDSFWDARQPAARPGDVPKNHPQAFINSRREL